MSTIITAPGYLSKAAIIREVAKLEASFMEIQTDGLHTPWQFVPGSSLL